MPEYAIRNMREDDLTAVLEWRNHPEIRRYMYTQQVITYAEHCAWFKSASDNTHKHLLIFEIDSLPMGFVNLGSQENGKIADWGFYLAPDAVKGAGAALGKAALNYAFNQLNLHKVCGQAIEYNQRSALFHQRLGFRIEGTLRDQFYDGQNYHAVLCFGLLNTEWNNLEVK